MYALFGNFKHNLEYAILGPLFVIKNRGWFFPTNWYTHNHIDKFSDSNYENQRVRITWRRGIFVEKDLKLNSSDKVATTLLYFKAVYD